MYSPDRPSAASATAFHATIDDLLQAYAGNLPTQYLPVPTSVQVIPNMLPQVRLRSRGEPVSGYDNAPTGQIHAHAAQQLRQSDPYQQCQAVFR